MSDDVKTEIDEMNKMLDSVLGPSKDEPSEEEPKKEPESKSEDEPEPKDEKEPESKPEPEPEPTPEPKKEEDKKQEPDDLAKTVETLRLELAELKAKKAEPPPKKESEPKPAVPEIAEQDFVGDLDLDEMTRDPKKLNEVFNTIYKKARTDSEQALIAGLSDRISTHIAATNYLNKAVEDFYSANEDLKPFKKVVSTVFKEVMEDNPARTLDELLSTVSTEVRTRLELPKKESKKEVKEDVKKSDKPPKLPSKGSSAGKPPDKVETDSLQSQLEEMDKALRR